MNPFSDHRGENHYKKRSIAFDKSNSESSLSVNKTNSIPYCTCDSGVVLFITTYPPRECGIATYSQDLIRAINNKFSNSLRIKICALETGDAKCAYPDEVEYVLNTSLVAGYEEMASTINNSRQIEVVLIQFEFGLFKDQEEAFMRFLFNLAKPIVIVFHTVLPHPDEQLKLKVQRIAAACKSIIVMTHNSADILTEDYHVPRLKINVIAHGTHLVPHLNKNFLKRKYGIKNRKVLTTFGLLSSGKGIETTLEALPAIIKCFPEVVFLVIGKTHPEVVKHEGERYRESLEKKVKGHGLQNHVF